MQSRVRTEWSDDAKAVAQRRRTEAHAVEPRSERADVPTELLRLQRLAGNRAVFELLGSQRSQMPLQRSTGAPSLRGRFAPAVQRVNGDVSTAEDLKKKATTGFAAIRKFVGEGHAFDEGNDGRGEKEDPLDRRLPLGEKDGYTNPKTQSGAGAYYASQMGRREMIGSVTDYKTKAQRAGHLAKFMGGAHAFITNEAYLKIRGMHLTEKNFNAWGSDSNFVAPLSAADQILEEAAAPDTGRGIYHLEEKLGVGEGDWVRQSESANYAIWRFIILRPEALNIRMPRGTESGAYQTAPDWKTNEIKRGDWRPGGATKGGIPEAVIDKVGEGQYGATGMEAGEKTRESLEDLEEAGVLKVHLESALARNTERVLAGKRSPK